MPAGSATVVFLTCHRSRPGGDFYGALSNPRPAQVGPGDTLGVR
jgi:hypothetical protein